MEINRPATPELTPEQQAAMEHFRQRVHALTLSGGLTPDTVRNVVQAMRQHPQFSREILQVLADEAKDLREIAPGQSLLDLGQMPDPN
jgi:acyl transferase domain-containing protein